MEDASSTSGGKTKKEIKKILMNYQGLKTSLNFTAQVIIIIIIIIILIIIITIIFF